MQRQMEELFQDNLPREAPSSGSYPPLNIWANEESALITAEIPGAKTDSLEINVTGDTLSVSGTRESEGLPEGSKYHRKERSTGQFERSIQLPYTIDVEKVKAQYNHGILEIILPRIEAEKPKKINVKVG
jgi:HSP20 family protein